MDKDKERQINYILQPSHIYPSNFLYAQVVRLLIE
jgi:hypothetical protein